MSIVVFLFKILREQQKKVDENKNSRRKFTNIVFLCSFNRKSLRSMDDYTCRAVNGKFSICFAGTRIKFHIWVIKSYCEAWLYTNFKMNQWNSKWHDNESMIYARKRYLKKIWRHNAFFSRSINIKNVHKTRYVVIHLLPRLLSFVWLINMSCIIHFGFIIVCMFVGGIYFLVFWHFYSLWRKQWNVFFKVNNKINLVWGYLYYFPLW